MVRVVVARLWSWDVDTGKQGEYPQGIYEDRRTGQRRFWRKVMVRNDMCGGGRQLSLDRFVVRFELDAMTRQDDLNFKKPNVRQRAFIGADTHHCGPRPAFGGQRMSALCERALSHSCSTGQGQSCSRARCLHFRFHMERERMEELWC